MAKIRKSTAGKHRVSAGGATKSAGSQSVQTPLKKR